MSLIIVHDPLTTKLAAVNGQVELCAPDGTVLGYFTPAKESRKYKLEPPASDEELNRRFSKGGGRSLSEILRDLENRG